MESRQKEVDLFNAVNKGNADKVITLLRAGTSTNAKPRIDSSTHDYWKQREGWTPLHVAADKGYISICKTLLYYGADPDIRHSKGKTPEEVAIDNGDPDCADTIKYFDKRFSGKAIFERFTTSAVSEADIEKYAKNKEGVFAYMLGIKDKTLRKLAFETAKDADTFLGKLFWFQRGGSQPCLESGMLSKIVTQLAEEEKVSKPIEVSSTAKITESIRAPSAPLLPEQVCYPHLMTPPMAVSAPVYFTAVPMYSDWYQQAVPLSHSYPPMVQAPQPTNDLQTVYFATNPHSFTNQMNNLPRVSELPALQQGRSREEKQLYQYGS